MDHKIITDRMGFPMLKVDDINAYIHFYPVTKIQFEYFLTSVLSKDFDETWYDEILQLNPRISPSQVRYDNYWNAFITGVMPKEAIRFAEWCGDNFDVPTLEEWCKAYKSLKEQPTLLIDEIFEAINPKPRVRTLLERLEDAPKRQMQRLGLELTIDYQMFLRRGVIEWVLDPLARSPWGGMGKLNRNFQALATNPDMCEPTQPRDPENSRLFYYGFRLIKRL